MSTTTSSYAPPTESETASSWPLRRLELKVLDLPTVLAYYRGFGLNTIAVDASSASLGFGGHEVLRLRTLENGQQRPRRTAGMFHFALLLPDEVQLGSFLRHSIDTGILDGYNDHQVSQALYLNDPEGNGIEVYADRPRDQWPFVDGQLSMGSVQLDIPRLLSLAEPWEGFPETSRLGHMHLNASNIEESRRFYADLGMNVMTEGGPFCFMSWDGYHHHLGLNTLEGSGIPIAQPEYTGLDHFEISRPGLEPGRYRDPNGIDVVVAA